MGIYKRDGIYWGRKRSKGHEFRRSLETTDRRAAQRRFADWCERLAAGAWGERARRSFGEAVEKFILEHCSALKPSTAKRYAVSLKNLAEIFAPLTLDQVSRDKLAEYAAARRATPTKGRGHKHARQPSPVTIRRDLACLSSLMSSAEEWDWIPEGSNPVPGFLKRSAKRGLKEASPRTRYLSQAEETALIAAATPAVRRAIAVAIDTGLRLDEQFSLTWPQIDFRRGLVALRDRKRLKSGRPRFAPLPPRAAAAIAELVTQRKVGKLPTLYVFRHDDGRRLLSMKKGLAAAARRARIEDLHWHDLRRTAGCRWLQRDGRTLDEVQILLGHSSVKVTESTYAFLEGEAVAADVAAKGARPPALVIAVAQLEHNPATSKEAGE